MPRTPVDYTQRRRDARQHSAPYASKQSSAPAAQTPHWLKAIAEQRARHARTDYHALLQRVVVAIYANIVANEGQKLPHVKDVAARACADVAERLGRTAHIIGALDDMSRQEHRVSSIKIVSYPDLSLYELQFLFEHANGGAVYKYGRCTMADATQIRQADLALLVSYLSSSPFCTAKDELVKPLNIRARTLTFELADLVRLDAVLAFLEFRIAQQ